MCPKDSFNSNSFWTEVVLPRVGTVNLWHTCTTKALRVAIIAHHWLSPFLDPPPDYFEGNLGPTSISSAPISRGGGALLSSTPGDPRESKTCKKNKNEATEGKLVSQMRKGKTN